jgi:uncharacterized damage-inducible protein DinB
MKQIFTICFVLLAIAVSAQKKTARFWTEDQRASLVKHLESSQQELIREVEKLSEAQLHFKADTASWSIAQVMEHLAVQEEHLYWDLFHNQYTPEQPQIAGQGRTEDREFLAYAADPAKEKALWVSLPLGRFQTREDLLAYFNRSRTQVVRYVQESPTDFRVHFIYRSREAGIWHRMDMHQYTLGFVAHTQRHTSQIKKIKAHPNFPQ